jgi:hypothetical protein
MSPGPARSADGPLMELNSASLTRCRSHPFLCEADLDRRLLQLFHPFLGCCGLMLAFGLESNYGSPFHETEQVGFFAVWNMVER